jgi:CRP/FNR family cyclic AMP-dependent transcriptional regulator
MEGESMNPKKFRKLADENLSCGLHGEGFLTGVSPDTRRAFENISYRLTFPEGTMLFAQEDEPRGLFVVVKGSVKISMTSAAGNTVILRISRSGDVLGFYEVLDGGPYQATAEALELSQIIFVKREAFRSFLHEHPDAALEVARGLGNDYQIACEQVRTLAVLHSAPKKLARFLLKWASSGRGAKDGIRAKLTLTHEEIGQMIGISRETVTRTLGDFRNQHLVRVEGSMLLIQNPVTLAQFAEIQGVVTNANC